MLHTMVRWIVPVLLAVAPVLAGTTVKSKQGELNLLRSPGGDDIICTSTAQETMRLLSKEDLWSMVEAWCGKGWVQNAALLQLQETKDKDINLQDYIVQLRPENPGSVIILELEDNPWAEVSMNRDFRDMLTQTFDREKMERSNAEN